MWTVFYDDGSKFSSLDGRAQDAPRQGVVCITQGSSILHRQETYCWERGSWVGHDRIACERYLDKEKHPVRLAGYSVTNERFLEIFAEAKKAKHG